MTLACPLARAKAAREPFEEITQELIPTRHKVLIGGCTKEGVYFTFGYFEPDTFHRNDHIGIFHIKGDTQFPKDPIVVDRSR